MRNVSHNIKKSANRYLVCREGKLDESCDLESCRLELCGLESCGLELCDLESSYKKYRLGIDGLYYTLASCAWSSRTNHIKSKNTSIINISFRIIYYSVFKLI